MRRLKLSVVYLVFVLLWCVVACGALELYASIVRKRDVSATEAYTTARQMQGQKVQAELAQQLDPAALETAPAKPDIRDAAALDEAGRAKLANDRGELIVLCDSTAKVTAVYAPSSPEIIAGLAKRIQPGGVLTDDLFASLSHEAPLMDEAQDCLMAIQSAAMPGGSAVRSYQIEFEDGSLGTAECRFEGQASAPGTVALFVGESMWEVPIFRYRKNVTYWQTGQKYHLNNVGFRGRDVVLPKPPGVYRIVCIGASTTAEGLTDKLTYPALLERRLREYFKDDRVEVVNCGVIGIHSDGEDRRIADYLALQPDLVIYYNYINDTVELCARFVEPHKSGATLLQRLKWFLRKSRFVYGHFNAWLWLPDGQFRAALQEWTVGNMRKLFDAATASGAEVAVCSFAGPDIPRLDKQERLYYDACLERTIGALHGGGCGILNAEGYYHVLSVFNDEVRRLCEEKGYLYVPVAENLKGGTNYFYDVCHCYVMGIDRKAEIIFDHIKDFVAEHLNATAPKG